MATKLDQEWASSIKDSLANLHENVPALIREVERLEACIGHLSEALRDLIKDHPCKIQGACHCSTCLAQHAISASG